MKPVTLPPLPAEAATALARGQKLEAIKIVREHTGLGLKESKELVEAHEAQADPRAASSGSSATGTGHAGMAPGEVPRSGSRGMLIVAAVVLAIGGYGLARWLGAL